METLKSSDSPRVIAEKIDKNLSLSKKGYKYHFDVKPPANPDEKTLWIDLFVKTIIKEINTKTYADEYFAAHPSINKNTFKYIGDDGKPTLEFKKMIYGDDYDPDAKYILQPKNSTIVDFCKPIERQAGIKPYDLDDVVFNTKNVNTLNDVFNDDNNLKSIDTSSWDTNKVTNMFNIFYRCNSLSSLDVSKWDTGKVTNMTNMFFNCNSLSSLDVSKWNTSKVTSMTNMFYNCKSLTSLDVSKWDTRNVTNMSAVFYICKSLSSLDVSKWNTSKVTNMNSTFMNCGSMTSLDVSKWDTKNVTDMSAMFNSCPKLHSLDLSNWNTSNVTNMANMFNGCSSLTSLDISEWDTSKVTAMSFMFANCSSLTTINGILDFKNCAYYNGIFINSYNITSIKVKNLPTDIDTFCSTARIDKSKVIVVA